ncbi:MAG: ABC transporter ATP-binding protein [Rubrivivax sp.]|jgi:ABC-type lipoprotein export system ATPase subunit|nr:ABC transporter ATP-binding protein [Betaproteobacteria bacterium]MBP6319454.1 ABC transporter ATP-binding protein [Rubrivivax sp.]MBK7276816.1 ABC transporter ATP-binding protein [Betaproteobacteria bacterium]MBK7458640.1 ABC transporter ATP-binding protein [Betaproteobacteria bacterium]MBK7515581.1 ABC transporter ATP-binding protein [Betaproteobacteria bacterium]
MSEAILLEVSDLGRDYDRGRVRALHEVSFSAQRGQTLALTGPSGCGKSTLLSLIGLLDRPDRGRVQVDGIDLAGVRRGADFRARRVGFVFQFHHMVPTMTLQENVEAPMLALGVPLAQRRARAAQLLDSMGLGARAGFLPTHVSGGERQRAAVARALVNRPALLLADEPTGNLDSRAGEQVIELLVGHARSQQALLLVATHNPDIAAAMDRRIELLDGRRV